MFEFHVKTEMCYSLYVIYNGKYEIKIMTVFLLNHININ